MYEADLTSAESKATYDEIKAYVFEQTGLKINNLNIAQVKRQYGIIECDNYNKPKSENSRQPKVTPEKEEIIKQAINKITNLIMYGADDENLLDNGQTSEQISAAYINCLALYF